MRIPHVLLLTSFACANLWAQGPASKVLKQALRNTLETGSWALQAEVVCAYATGPKHRAGTTWFTRRYSAETIGHLTHISSPIEAYREYGGVPGAVRRQGTWVPLKRLQAGKETDALLLPLVGILSCAYDHREVVQWVDDERFDKPLLRAVCPSRMAGNLFNDVVRSGIFEEGLQEDGGRRYDDGSGSGEWIAAEILERVDRSRGKLVLDLRLGHNDVVDEIFLKVVLAARPQDGGKTPRDWEAQEHIVVSFHYSFSSHGELDPFPIPAEALSIVRPGR